ncbi:MAG: hypothetical protein HQL19_02955 [Candidatus Omnitrophica bacterium]|nr:hypothetical protein [Candidatus Omnitrophota bacterium]
MSTIFYRKLNEYFGLIAFGVFFGLLAFAATIEVKDYDIWLHMGMGKFILNHHVVPDVDVLSCSIAGKPWVNHEWLFQVIVYKVRALWGFDGLIYMQVGVVLLTFLTLLLLAYRKDRQFLIAVLFFFMMQIYQSRFTIRPDIFSLLFFVFFISILSAHIQKRWSIAALFLLQVLWSNMHGFFIFGPMLVFLALLAEVMKRYLPMPAAWKEEGRLTDEEYGRLKAAFVFVLLATLINPLTLRGATYPFGVLFGLAGESKIFFEHITELQHPLAWSTLFSLDDQVPYKVLIFLSLITFIFNRRRIDISAALLWLGFFGFSLVAVRNLIYFAAVAFLVMMTNCANLRLRDIVPFRFADRRFVPLTGFMVKVILICFFVSEGNGMAWHGYFDLDAYERKSEFLGVAQRGFPIKAVDFLEKNNIRGNFFNDFNSGAYLVGRVYPNVRVFIDGRTEVYGAAFFKEYEEIMTDGNEKTFDAAVVKDHLTGILINNSVGNFPAALLSLIQKKKEWVLVHFDFDGLVYLKDIPANRVMIDAHKIDLTQWNVKDPDLKRLGVVRATPIRNFYRAKILKAMGYPAPALLEVERAIEVNPAYAEAYALKGDLAVDQKDWEGVFSNYRKALYFDNENIAYRRKLVKAYFELNDVENGFKQAGRLIELAPDDSTGYIYALKLSMKKEQYKEAYDILVQVLGIDPKAASQAISAGDMFMEKKAWGWARKAYVLAVEKDARSAAAHEKLGDALKELKSLGGAFTEWQKSLALQKDNEALRKKIDAIKPLLRRGKVQ